MRRLIQLLACTMLLSAAAAAQTAPAPTPEKVLRIYRFYWAEVPYSNGICAPPTATQVAFSQGAGVVTQGEYRSSAGCVEPGHDLPVTLANRYKKRPERGKYTASLVMKNMAAKPIAAIDLDLVFRDTATGREFLTYHFRSEEKIGPGGKERIEHTSVRSRESDRFSPAAPDAALLARTQDCSSGPPVRDPKTGKVVTFRDNHKILGPAPCYYLPVVTRIEYADGTSWRPQP
jgi:hypothetical protein